MLLSRTAQILGAAGLLLWPWITPALHAQDAAGGQELPPEIRMLEAEIQRLQSQVDQLRANVPNQTSAVATVPAGARQGIPFARPDPSFGPSDWVPESWGPIRYQSPQARPRTPRELGVPPPPLDSPLDFPQFVPGSLAVRHGLGPASVTVTLEVVSPDGAVNYQVDPNRVVVRGSSPPDGTFTILNYIEQPLIVRWVARRVP
jgi:hypothetical protein